MGNTNNKYDEEESTNNSRLVQSNVIDSQQNTKDNQEKAIPLITNFANPQQNVRPMNQEHKSVRTHQNNTVNFKTITIYYNVSDNVKVQIPIQSENLTVQWLIQETEKNIKEEKQIDIITQLFRDKKIAALKCKTSKSECMDYLLTLMEAPISFLQDRDILETINVQKKAKKKRKPHLEDFNFLKVIGKGGFSNVLMVRKKDDGTIYAMKCLKKVQIKRENKVRHVMNEREILTQVSHPFIVKMQWAFQTEHYLFMILEFCPGGEIFYHMNKVQRFSEKVAKFYFSEILLAIEYLHNNNIFYRDLKPENILLDEEGHIKMTDFGISRIKFTERDRSTSFCGSPEYMSPEMLHTNRVHGRMVDIYALGALLFEMLTGLPPHFSESREEMYRKILHSTIEYPRYLSPMAKSLLKGLLMRNPDQRLGAKFGIKEVKEHPFCRDIDWDAVIEKRVLPPIKPSLRYSNFDPDYTSMPIRFTYEEDLVRSNITRRKSDPGLDAFNNMPNPVGGALVYPNFTYERRGEIQYQGLKFKQYQQPSNIKNQGTEKHNGDQSPQYSRPPSSTFRGYSFMNFRNDSISSIDNQGVEYKDKQQQNRDKSSQMAITQGNSHNVVKPNQNFFNIIDDYQFTSSQRSRTISFANQSLLTEGIEQKNIYAIDYQGNNQNLNQICFKANEFEFNAFNHQFPKNLQFQSIIGKHHNLEQRPYKSFVGLSTNQQNQDQQINLPQQVNQASEQAIYDEVIDNFEYCKDNQQQQPIFPKSNKNMDEIAEDENEGTHPEPTPPHKNNDEVTEFKSKRNSELFISMVTSKLIQNKEANLDQYAINLIKFNDEINHVKTERERKRKMNAQQQLKDTVSKGQQSRKGAHSQHANQQPLTSESRLRIDSNYTTRSGGGLSQDKEGILKKKKFQNAGQKVNRQSGYGINRDDNSKYAKTQTKPDQVKKKPQINNKTSRTTNNQLFSPKSKGQKQSLTNPQKATSNEKINCFSPKLNQKKNIEEKKVAPSAMNIISNKRKQDIGFTQVNLKSRNHQQCPSKHPSQYKNADTVNQGGLEQIDEIRNSEFNVKDQMSRTLVQPSNNLIGLQNQKKKLSRLNSPKNELSDQNKKSSKPSIQSRNNTNTRNRLKTSSHYVETPSYKLGTKKLFPTQEQKKENETQKIEQNKGSRSKNRIPKSQEREKKSSSENTLEDLEDNVDEFKVGETSKALKLNNPALTASIAVNQSRHQQNSMEFNSAAKSQQSASSSIINSRGLKKTPDQSKSKDMKFKTSTQHLLGQANSFLETSSSKNISIPSQKTIKQKSASKKVNEENFPKECRVQSQILKIKIIDLKVDFHYGM